MKILITGARSGIGFYTGIILVKMGHIVYFGTRTEREKEGLKENIRNLKLGDRAKVIKLDINRKEDRKKILKLDLDILINNAAISVGGPILDLKVSKIQENFETNVFSTIKLTKMFINDINKKKKMGNVVIMSSLAGKVPIPFIGSYAATKASLSMISQVLYQELLLSNSKIRVKLIEPGFYHTGFNQEMINQAKDIIEENANYLTKFVDFEASIIRLLEVNKIESIAKKVAVAATSRNYKLRYSIPLYQNIFAKIYSFLFK